MNLAAPFYCHAEGRRIAVHFLRALQFLTRRSHQLYKIALNGRNAFRSLPTSFTPSELSKTVVWIVRFRSLTHASNSVRAMRTRPQAMYSQNE